MKIHFRKIYKDINETVLIATIVFSRAQRRKIEEQMLFSAEDANKFAAWLQRVLTKIQAITVQKQKNNNNFEENKADVNKQKEDAKSEDSTKVRLKGSKLKR